MILEVATIGSKRWNADVDVREIDAVWLSAENTGNGAICAGELPVTIARLPAVDRRQGSIALMHGRS